MSLHPVIFCRNIHLYCGNGTSWHIATLQSLLSCVIYVFSIYGSVSEKSLFFYKKNNFVIITGSFVYSYLLSNQLLKLHVANSIKLNYSRHQKSKVISEWNLFFSFNNFLTHLFLLLTLMSVTLANEAKIFVHSKRDWGLDIDYLTVK